MYVHVYMYIHKHVYMFMNVHTLYTMVNIEIRLIIFFAAKDGEALYSQQKQDQEQTVAQTMNLLPKSVLN